MVFLQLAAKASGRFQFLCLLLQPLGLLLCGPVQGNFSL